ncbi:MAG TPA: STAS domain-containing protein [bacterium]|nr:STAS domain-containing protein [bacterium]
MEPATRYAGLLSQVHRTRRRYVSLCYQFQEVRFTFARLRNDLRRTRLACDLAAPYAAVPDPPIYAFTRTAAGVVSIVRRPRITGGAGPAFLHCRTEPVPEGCVLCAEGEVDVATAPLFANAVAAAFRESRRVIVDLSRLGYLDGAGVHVLEDAAQAHGGRFVVVGSRPEIHRLFDILGLTNVLPVVATVDAARAYIRDQ